MSMSINNMHNNAMMNMHQIRASREMVQDAVHKIKSERFDLEDKAAAAPENRMAAQGDGVAVPTEDQSIRGHLASLRMNQAVAQFHQSASDMRTEMGDRVGAVRDRISGLAEQVRESENPEAAEQLNTMIDNARTHFGDIRENAADRVQGHKDELASRLDDVRENINSRLSTMTDRLTSRADEAIEKASEAGNDQRAEMIQDRLSEALARLDDKSTAVNTRIDEMQARLAGVNSEDDDIQSDLDTDAPPAEVTDDMSTGITDTNEAV